MGLWPFTFKPQNEVSWLSIQNGISFEGRGIVYSSDLLDAAKLFQNKSISIEMWLEPDTDALWHVDHWHYGQILSLYNNDVGSESMIIGQWASILSINGSSFPVPRNYKEIGLAEALKMGKTSFITITSDLVKTAVYVNGRPSEVFPDVTLLGKSNDLSVRLLLGNSPTGQYPWRGKIFGLAIYNKALTGQHAYQHYQMWAKRDIQAISKMEGLLALYPFDELHGNIAHNYSGIGYNLMLPPTLNILQKDILTLPWRDFHLNRSYLKDVLINLVGFVPFGFFFLALFYGTKKSSSYGICLIVTIMGVGTSLTIELTQVFLPLRSSSLTDMICNTIGTIIGIILFKFVLTIIHPSKHEG